VTGATNSPTTSPSQAPPPIVIAIPSSFSVANMEVPDTPEKFNETKILLQNAIFVSVNRTLSSNQTLQSIVVTSIGGMTGVGRRRFLAATKIDFVMTLEEICAVNCDSTAEQTEIIADALYDQVTSDLTESVQTGQFVADLNAIDTGAVLSEVVVEEPTYEEYVQITQSPTKSPTKSPVTNSPTTKPPTNSPVTNSPTTKSPTNKPVAPGGALWYPDWVSAERTCKNDGNAPAYMTMNTAAWMFKDR
jgi:hypothetical protein